MNATPQTRHSRWSCDGRDVVSTIRREGSEDAARKHLASWLRQAAEQVERGTMPDVYGCKLPEYGYTGSLGMGEFSVTFMWPWG